MPEPRYHKSLRLQNFTVFNDVQFDFVDGINAFIGENGSGKTHLLKVLFATQLAFFREQDLEFIFEQTFQVSEIGDLIRTPTEVAACLVEGIYSRNKWGFQCAHPVGIGWKEIVPSEDVARPVFIPSIDMMGHTRRFVSTFDEYNIDFDLTHRDIVSLLLSPEKRTAQNQEYMHLLDLLQKKIGGEIVDDSERFYLQSGDYQQPFPLVAEGLRKLATLYQLIKNGFLQPGTTLFWDEPEVSLNPSLMDEVVQVLLELSRQGVQVFLATHSHLILKELEVQSKKSESLRFFALERDEAGTKVHSADSYLELSPNLIEQQYLSLYDRSIEKRLSESGAGE